MRNIWGFIAVFVTLFTLTNVKAFSVDNKTVYLQLGENDEISLYVNSKNEISSVSFLLTYSTNNLKGTDFKQSDGFQHVEYDGSYHKVTFNEPKKGKIEIGKIIIKTVTKDENDKEGKINIREDKRSNNTEISNFKSLEVVVKFEEQEPVIEEPVIKEPVITTNPSSLLDRIESSIVNIELKENVFEYEILVPSNIKTLDLNPIPISSDINVRVSSQDIANLDDKTITITLDNGQITQQYKIKVKLKKVVQETEIDTTTEVKEYHYKWKYIVIILLGAGAMAGVYFFKFPKNDK